jgi:ubiquinone/menaquinone biosynthesis C-methylase UbiE
MTMMTQRQHSGILGRGDARLRMPRQIGFPTSLALHGLRAIGLRAGMRVRVIGCGGGDVALLAATIVGPTGSVLASDRSLAALALAKRRADMAGLGNLRFLAADAPDSSHDTPADALIGQLSALRSHDPVSALRDLRAQVRPGGLVIVHDSQVAGSLRPPSPLPSEMICCWVLEMLGELGLDADAELWRAFAQAGLRAPQLALGAHVLGSADTFVYATQQVHGLPQFERLDVASLAELRIDMLGGRRWPGALEGWELRLMPALAAVWSRRPAEG